MPVLWIVGGLIAVMGLSLLNGTVEKVEKLVDNPLIEIGGVVIVILVVFFVFKSLKG